MLVMPFTSSISSGIGAGFIAYVVVKLVGVARLRSARWAAMAAPNVHPSRRAQRWATALRPPRSPSGPLYRPRRPTETPLYPVVQHHLETFLARAEESDPGGWGLPGWVERDFRAYLRCGIPAYGFARVRCGDCGQERLVPFSCKGRGACPSCNARRMAEVAAHLTDHVVPHLPVRQWVRNMVASKSPKGRCDPIGTAYDFDTFAQDTCDYVVGRAEVRSRARSARPIGRTPPPSSAPRRSAGKAVEAGRRRASMRAHDFSVAAPSVASLKSASRMDRPGPWRRTIACPIPPTPMTTSTSALNSILPVRCRFPPSSTDPPAAHRYAARRRSPSSTAQTASAPARAR